MRCTERCKLMRSAVQGWRCGLQGVDPLRRPGSAACCRRPMLFPLTCASDATCCPVCIRTTGCTAHDAGPVHQPSAADFPTSVGQAAGLVVSVMVSCAARAQPAPIYVHAPQVDVHFHINQSVAMAKHAVLLLATGFLLLCTAVAAARTGGGRRALLQARWPLLSAATSRDALSAGAWGDPRQRRALWVWLHGWLRCRCGRSGHGGSRPLARSIPCVWLIHRRAPSLPTLSATSG